MALLAATIIILVAIAAVAILLYAAILDIAGLVRGDLGAQSQMQQRRYDDVIGICERIEAILEARQIGVLKFHVAKEKQDLQNITWGVGTSVPGSPVSGGLPLTGALNGTDNQV